ncbi:hypothetical protein EJA71_24950 [Pseudomonas sp. PB106]|nr:hypothetical protein EJA71_24950 [Pseudomonas sp. PB106]
MITNLLNTRDPCGSWLASDSGGSVNIDIDCADLIAGKPAPTGISGGHWINALLPDHHAAGRRSAVSCR